MVTTASMDPAAWLRQQLETADVDLLREMVRSFAEALMSADADAVCGAAYGEVSAARVNRRNGYRHRDWDTRVGSIELAVPKLRKGSYFPSWLLEPRRRAEQALVQVVADCYLAGVSTRRVDKLVQQLGLDGISKSQVSQLAKSSTRPSTRGATALSTPAPTPIFGSTRCLRRCARAGGWSTSGSCTPWASTARATARPSASTSSPARMGRAGPRFCAGWSPVACRGCSWWSPTPTQASKTPSPPPCPAARGSAAAPISCGIF